MKGDFEMIMTDLEVCRLSAEGLGKRIVNHPNDPPSIVNSKGGIVPWNPLANAEQRWKCVEWLRGQRYGVSIGDIDYHELISTKDTQDNVVLECPAAEFPARAVAELRRREEKNVKANQWDDVDTYGPSA